MDKGVFRFIYRFSKRQQLLLLLMTFLSYPFYYFSLDLPKTIVNEAIGGREFPKNLFGVDLSQIEYLLTLAFAFLGLVLINGGFKYVINVYRGVVGERMLRRLRYMLIHQIMRFPLPHFRNVSEGEIVAMVTTETEPLGGFVGEAFSLPAFQGGMLITALVFMFVQDPILGLAAIILYPVQGYLIPKLQRQVNQLAKERVKNVRKLSERINEMVSGASDIHAHDTVHYELADFSDRLGTIFGIRYDIYRKKFFIKFLNNFLAQLTPFFFFSIGGYFVINGELSIGALVAILAAYKDLAPPWKELLNFYQRMEDARIKYSQLIERFEPAGLLPESLLKAEKAPTVHLDGKLVASNLTVEEDEGSKTVEGASFAFGTDEHVAILGGGGSGKNEVAKILARQLIPTGGTITIGAHDLTSLPESVTGRQIGYVDSDAYVRSGSIGDNLFYGLKHYPVEEGYVQASEHQGNAEWRRKEAEYAGNSPFDIHSNWLDTDALGISDERELLDKAIAALQAVSLEQDVIAFGLRSTVAPSDHPDLTDGILRARGAIEQRIQDPAFSDLIEQWDPRSYNRNASVAENILFGTPVGDSFDIETLGRNEIVLAALDNVGLRNEFLEMGRKIAALMVELFRDLQPGHEFFERFSFISADDLPEFQHIVATAGSDGVQGLSPEQRDRLMDLPFRVVVSRHRLGLIGEEMQHKLLAARTAFAEVLPDEHRAEISFFDREAYNPASSILDNAIFGKIASGRSDNAEKVQQMVTEVLDGLSLRTAIVEVGLTFQVGVAGRRLSSAQRQKLAIARNLVKQPRLLIVNEATGPLDSATRVAMLGNVRSMMSSRGLVWVNGEEVDSSDFDRVLKAESGRIREISHAGERELEAAAEAAPDDAIGTDAELLSRIPFFAGLDRSQLKLLAFTNERLSFQAGDTLYQQGDSAESACVVVDGSFSVIVDTAEGRIKVAEIERGGLIGELALLCEAPRTASVIANGDATVLLIAKDIFIQLIRDNPAVGANLSRILAQKLEAMMRGMTAHYELYDPVTGLPNRNLFLDYLKTAPSIDSRAGARSSLVLLNFPKLDQAEQLQDLDHRQTMLREIAERIRPVARVSDTFARLEGFRFGLIARTSATDEEVKQLLQRIRSRLAKPVSVGGTDIDLAAVCEIDVHVLDDKTYKDLADKV